MIIFVILFSSAKSFVVAGLYACMLMGKTYSVMKLLYVYMLRKGVYKNVPLSAQLPVPSCVLI